MSPFILVGPEGAGKTLLLQYCVSQLKGASVYTLHCSAQTQAAHVVQVGLHSACTTDSLNASS